MAVTHVRYIPPETGGSVEMTVSAELAQLIHGFLGTISLFDLRPLPEAREVRDEISDVHRALHRALPPSPWRAKGRSLRFGEQS